MPTVPYDPVPSVKPDTSATTRPIRINTNEEMFGAGIGKATEKLGQTLSHIGDEFANTAISYAKLDAETQAAKAATEYYKQSGDIDIKFRSLSGEAPKNNLMQHGETLDSTRMSLRNGLSPYAAKIYDQQTLRSMSYDMRNAMSHAATESKRAAVQASQENQSAAIDKAMKDPFNEERAADIINDVKRQAIDESKLTDGDVQDAQTTQIQTSKVKSAVGSAAAQVAMARAKTDPAGALKFIDKYRDQMHEPIYQKLREDILDRSVHVNSDMESARITAPYTRASRYQGSPRVNDAIEKAAAKYGLDPNTLKAFGSIESSMDPASNANKPTQYKGLFQLGREEWAKFGEGDIYNPEDNAMAAAKLLKSHSDTFKEKNGREPNDAELYMAHQQGMGFHLNGTMTNISGNPYPGMRGPQTPDSFQAGWGAEVARRKETFTNPPISGAVTERSLEDLRGAAQESAQRLYPDDPVRKQRFEDETIQKAFSRANVQQKVFNDHLTTMRNSIHDTLNQQVKDIGRQPTSIEEATKVDPNFLDKYEYLTKNSPQDKQRIDAIFMKNAKEEIPETQERRDFYTKFLGMSNEDRARVDPNAAFTRGDTTKALADKMSKMQAEQKHLVDMGQKVDPILNRNQALLFDMKAYTSRNDPTANERYQWLRGAAMQRLEDYEAQHKAQMPLKEQDQMMKDLSREVVTSKGWLWDTKKRQFEIESPAAQGMPENAKKAPDGKFYVPDPNRAGKYMEVRP